MKRWLSAITTATVIGTSALVCSPTAFAAPDTAQAIDAANTNPAAAARLPRIFDLQAHRGGAKELPEESAAAFLNAAKLRVTSEELDIGITADGVPIVWHNSSIGEDKCEDTAPVVPGDPAFPYVGKNIKDLTWAQIQTIDCGHPAPEFASSQDIPGTKILRLEQVFDLLRDDPDIHYNIELKVEPTNTRPAEVFVTIVLDAIAAAGTGDRVLIQSFDWHSLELVRQRDSNMPLSMLYSVVPVSYSTLAKASSDPVAASSELNPNIIETAKRIDAQVLSPSSFDPLATSPEFVARAHAAGLRVLPWTSDNEAEWNRLVDAGVDGFITNSPTAARAALEARGVVLR